MANPFSRWWRGRRTNPTATSPDDSPVAASPTRPLLGWWRGRRSRGTDVKHNASDNRPPPSESPPVAPTNPPPSISKAPVRSAMKKSAGAQDPGNKQGRGRVHFGEGSETIIEVVSDSDEESSESTPDFVPSTMDVLARLSVTYPFVQAVFLLFKFVSQQKELINDRKSKHLFEEMAKGVRALTHIDELDLEQSETSIKNLTEICEKMAMDIKACCNVLDVYQRLQPLQKFLTAGTWNELFAEHAIQFEARQQELHAALNLSVAAPRGMTMIVAEFDSCKPPHAADFDMWIAEVGGREKLMSDETSTSWGKLLVYQTPLVSEGPSGNPRVGEPRVKEFREEYELISRDVVSLLQDNRKSLAHRLTLVDTVDPDLTTEIARSRDSIGDMDRESYTAPTTLRPPIMSRMPSSASIKKAIGAPGFESKPRRESLHIWDHTEHIVDPASDAVMNSNLQDFGDALLDLIPPLMDALTSLSKIHPFLTVVFIPFKLAYTLEKDRHDNDRKRQSLFKQMTDAVRALLQMERLDFQHSQWTKDGIHVTTRLDQICRDMGDNVKECSNIIDLYHKRQPVLRYLTEGTWNERFATCVMNFQKRDQELSVALNLQIAADIQDVKTQMQDLKILFSKMLPTHGADFAHWIRTQGGEGGIEGVLENEDKCKDLLKYQTRLVGTHSLELTGPQASGKRGESPFTGKTLHDEYLLITQAKDLNSLLAQNMKVLELSIDAQHQDLTAKVEGAADRVVDRVVDAFHRGPHERLQDRIMVEVWKGQGWRGSTKTWKLVLALRDHLVELAEMEKSGDGRNTPAPLPHQDSVSTTVPGDNVAEEEKLLSPEDLWAIECLQVRRLRNLNQVLDPDASGFSTIAEVNTFTKSCPPKWRLPHWVAYWVVGWQASATAYCAEIDDLVAQMVLIRDRVRVKMPGNRKFIDDYLDVIWPIVIALTSGVERHYLPHFLARKFQDYVDSQEKTLRTRLEKIRYVIDSASTVVQALIPGDHIERTILTLVALLMRRHLAKMHLCLTKDISENELFDDSLAIRVVVDVAWDRYSHLLDSFKHQQVADLKPMFEWFSCGLFRNYFGWKSPLNREHYRNTVIQSPSAEIQEINPDELEGILVYNANGSKLPIPQQGMGEPDESQSFNGQLSDVRQLDKHLESRERSLPPLIEVAESTPTHDTQMNNIGLWFGFHSDTHPPYNGMFEVCIATSATDAAQVVILGSGAAESFEWTTTGQITGEDHSVHFRRSFSDGYVQCYDGIFDPVRRIISGTYCHESDDPEDSSRFFLKPGVMRNPSKSLLVFALDTVVGHFRRKAAFARALEYMKRVQLYVQLSVQSSGPGSFLHAIRMLKTLDEVNWEPEVRCEMDMLASWYKRAEESHGFLQCDACHKSISRSRILCLECEPKEFENSVDLDAQDACISASTLIGRSDVMHTPTHLLLKIRYRLLLRDHADTKQAAIHCSKLATLNYETTDNGFTQCLICCERAYTPCWYCLDCEAVEAFVCDACEKEIDNLAPWKYQRRYRTELANSTPHNILHRLIRFGVKPEIVPKPDTERMASIEHLRLLESRMSELLNQRHNEMTSRVDEVDARLGRMESLLQSLRQSSNISL